MSYMQHSHNTHEEIQALIERELIFGWDAQELLTYNDQDLIDAGIETEKIKWGHIANYYWLTGSCFKMWISPIDSDLSTQDRLKRFWSCY